MKAISYSLFGYNREREANSFDFSSYLRGFHINIRFNRILYPNWITVLNLDHATYNSPYKPIFDWHVSKGYAKISLQDSGAPLCKSMLWRLKTVFDYDHPNWRYTHVICRDLDSIATYREAQMVQQWVEEDKAIHCITDSISHTIPMMGGMVGFRPGYVNDLLKLNINPEQAWDKLLSLAPDIDYRRKGSDQDFLNRIVHPKCAHNATEHFILGMRHDVIENNGRHYSIDPSIKPEGVSDEMRDKLEEKKLAGHVGAAGFYETPTMYFLYHHDPYKEDYKELEEMPEFDKIFYWRERADLR
jgi:hypothetical protein